VKVSPICFKAATVFALSGIAMGIAMAASRDHSVIPAHAHLNLLGWVSLFLFGVYYKLNPTLDASRLARAQVITWCIGTVVLTIGVAGINLGYEIGDPIAGLGTLVVLAGMVLFAVIVFRPAAADQAAPALLTPAE
jgi:hypothetical protein